MEYVEHFDDRGTNPNIHRPQDSQRLDVREAAGIITRETVIIHQVPYCGHESPFVFKPHPQNVFMANLPA